MAQQPSPAAPSGPQISGIIYTHYRYGGGPADRSDNRFDIERVYVNVRSALGDGLSARVTADVFQQIDTTRAGYYRGWAIRAKYAYVQYDAWRGETPPLGLRTGVRLGMLNTVVIEQIEEFWPRFISRTTIDRAGFMSSADLGAAVYATTVGGGAEFYATVTNGEGYQRGEIDRFKDYAARVTLRPFAGTPGLLRRLAIVPWGSLGSRRSAFATGPGTVEPVTSGVQRDRWGVFAGYRAARLSAGAEYAVRIDGLETADTLVDVRPQPGRATSRVVAGFVAARPLALIDTSWTAPLGLVLRAERMTSTTAPSGRGTFVIAGATWDLSSRVSIALDYQEEARRDAFQGPDTRTYFLHAMARF